MVIVKMGIEGERGRREETYSAMLVIKKGLRRDSSFMKSTAVAFRMSA